MILSVQVLGEYRFHSKNKTIRVKYLQFYYVGLSSIFHLIVFTAEILVGKTQYNSIRLDRPKN